MPNSNLCRSVASFLLVVFNASVFCVSVRADTPLRVMAYNVRYASDRQPNAWPTRRPVAKQMLAKYAPDVIGMQEALYRQVKDFAKDMPDYSWIGTGRDGGSRGEFMAVFYRTERLEPLEFDHYWLSDTPNVVGSTTWGNSNRRMVTWVRFRDRSSDRQFYFINTHFDHRIQVAREKSARLVVERSAKLNDHPAILVGDFNARAVESAPYQTLLNDGEFRDSYVAGTPEINGTFHGFTGKPDGRRIDWVLYRGAVKPTSTEIVTYHQESQYPSDHFPVVTNFEWVSKDGQTP